MSLSNLQDLLVTSGFPRSGNTFVNYAFHKLFNLKQVNFNRHTVIVVEKRDHTFVPFRHPLDCISSWHLYQDEFLLDTGILEDDFKFYLRFHTSLEQLSNKITLLDFDLFKDDLTYLSSKVTDLYAAIPSNVTLEEVKEFMKEEDKGINLPRNTEQQKQIIQERIKDTGLYQDCVSIYESLKQREKK
jgi:hypothetical protein